MIPGKLEDIKLRPEKPLLCLEVNPPKGTDIEGILARYRGKLEGVDFLNITDSALAKMRMSPFAFAAILKQHLGTEPLVNLSCRDRNIIAMQGELLGAWAAGLRSIIALTGDAVSVGELPDVKGVFEMNSIGLLHLIALLNSGKDMAGNNLKGAPAFIPGVVVNPNARNPQAELRRLLKKKEAGAKYALSQPVFDVESSEGFLRQAGETGVPVFLGLMAVRSVAAARHLLSIPGIKLSEGMLKALDGAPEQDISLFSIEDCLRIARAHRGLVSGYHVITGASPALALQLCRELVRYIHSDDAEFAGTVP